MAKYPADVLVDTMSGFASAAGFDAFQTNENLFWRDFLDVFFADPGKDVALEASDDVVRVAVRPAAFMATIPFARDSFEGIGAGILLGLAFEARVDALKQQCLGALLRGKQ